MPFRRFLPIAVFFFILAVFTPESVLAAVSCSASVSPTSVDPGSSVGLTFTVTNTTGDETPIRWIMVSVPQEEVYTIISSNVTEWSISPSTTDLLLSGAELADGGSLSIPVYVQTQSTSTSSQAWRIQASDDPSGSNDIVECSGAPSTMIGAAPTSTSAPGEPTSTPAIITRYLSPTLPPTPTPDKRPPSVSFSTKALDRYQTAPEVIGVASDPRGVDQIDYSVDGKTYIPTTTTRLGSTTVPFRFSPDDLEDGTYSVTVHVRDTIGNTGIIRYGSITIDRIPPKIGGISVMIGADIAPIDPENGHIMVPAGTSARIVAQVIGGCTFVSSSIVSPERSGETKQSPLAWSYQTGVWSGSLVMPDTPGRYTLRLTARDGGGFDERNVATISVMKAGMVVGTDMRPIDGATVAVYRKTDEGFVLWDGSAWGIRNPRRVDASGSFSFIVPEGAYSIRVDAPGYRAVETSVGYVRGTKIIGMPIAMDRQAGWSVGKWFIPFPPYGTKTIPWQDMDMRVVGERASIIGRPLPDFSLQTRLGVVDRSTLGGGVISITAPWIPGGIEQLHALRSVTDMDRLALVIMPLLSTSGADILSLRGGYPFSIAGDPTGSTIGSFGIGILPYHILVDRYGVVRDVRYGYVEGSVLESWVRSIE